MNAPLALVVPTLGRSPWLGDVLSALASQAPAASELLVVHPEGGTIGIVSPWRAVSVARPASFSRAANAGLAATTAPWVGLVNDDAPPQPGWLEALTAAAAREPGVASLQGVQVDARDPSRCDGCGIAWNELWEAVQIGHGGAAPPASAGAVELFGVSATAALYRREALVQVALADGAVFDPRFGSWYEDVELAVRLRGAGWRALVVPTARARHAGGATGAAMPGRRQLRLARNRWWTVARLLGGRLPFEAARLLAADLRAARRALGESRFRVAAMHLLGATSALPALPRYLRRGEPVDPGPDAASVLAGLAGSAGAAVAGTRDESQ